MDGVKDGIVSYNIITYYIILQYYYYRGER